MSIFISRISIFLLFLAIQTVQAEIEESKLYGVYAESANTQEAHHYINVGTFDVKANVTGELTYDDNIYATHDREEADTVMTIKPTIEAKSAWNRHGAKLKAFITDKRYMSNSSEDSTAFGASAKGRLDIKRGTFLSGNIMLERRFEDRGEANASTAADGPTQYARRGGGLRFVHAPGRIKLTAGIKMEEHVYEDSKTSSGITINNGDRDRTQTIATLKTGYELNHDLEVYAQLNDVQTSYDEIDSALSDKRSSDGHDVLVGLSSTPSGKTQLQAYVGTSKRRYDAATLSDISAPAFGGALLYRPNGLTSVKIDLKRSIEETTASNAAGYINTALAARVEHALRRHLLLGAGAIIAENKYKGGTSHRKDDVVVLGIDGRYNLGRNLTASIGYEFTDRDSSESASDYTRGQLMTRIMGQF